MTMKWIEPESVRITEALRNEVGGHPLICETLVRRGIGDPESALSFLDPDCYSPTHFSEMPDISKSVDRLEHAIKNRERILIWGDFDVDGQTSTTVLFSTLKQLGGNVLPNIPVREKESHGIKVPSLKTFASQRLDLLLTCDTGISEHDAVDYANKNGIDVIITDHHELPANLPDAYSVINPQLLPADHPLKELPGVGVAYKLAEALFDRFNRDGTEYNADQFLDLVALGIVADVAILRDENRYLLQRGIEVLRATPRRGLRTLMEACQIDIPGTSEDHIGYYIAPRLNAIGRLGDANPVVELLTTDNLEKSRILTKILDDYNERRKVLQDQTYREATQQIRENEKLLNFRVLVLSDTGWPLGILGLVAGRLAEEYTRPVILITTYTDGTGRGRGSARSVDGINITDLLAANSHLLLTFGGHAGAAGLTVLHDNIPDLRRDLSTTVTSMIGEDLPEKRLQIDAFLQFPDLTTELVEDIQRLAPFGRGNPSLTIATRSLRISDQSKLGYSGNHMQFVIEDPDGNRHRVIRWRGAGRPVPDGTFSLAYTIGINEFRDKRELQIVWVDAHSES